VVVSAAAVSDAVGETVLHVPATPDPSFSSLEAGRFAEGEPVRVETTTVDAAVREHGLRPAVVKIDVEGGELRVVAGMEETLELRPALLVEVDPESGAELERRLAARGYQAYRIGRRGLEPGLAGAGGLFNAAYLPERAASQ
jgi:hypothetical protein